MDYCAITDNLLYTDLIGTMIEINLKNPYLSSYCLGADSSTEIIFSAIQKVFFSFLFSFFPLWKN